MRGSCRVEIDMTIDWKELHRLLKASFPVNVYADEGINEIQFGYVKRPVHRSRAYDRERFEVCNHRYSALCDGSHGAAVLNDCKYGISMRENELALSLLTAGASPEMRADNRVHEFRYAFMAWTGTFEDSDIVRQGYDFNDEPLIFPGKADLPAFAVPDHANIILDYREGGGRRKRRSDPASV
jgi:alpha-mannosidase